MNDLRKCGLDELADAMKSAMLLGAADEVMKTKNRTGLEIGKHVASDALLGHLPGLREAYKLGRFHQRTVMNH